MSWPGENEINLSFRSEVGGAPTFPDHGIVKTHWTNDSQRHGSPSTLDIKTPVFCASHLCFHTLGLWIPTEMKSILSSKIMTWTTEQQSNSSPVIVLFTPVKCFSYGSFFTCCLTQGKQQLLPLFWIPLGVVALQVDSFYVLMLFSPLLPCCCFFHFAMLFFFHFSS